MKINTQRPIIFSGNGNQVALNNYLQDIAYSSEALKNFLQEIENAQTHISRFWEITYQVFMMKTFKR